VTVYTLLIGYFVYFGIHDQHHIIESNTENTYSNFARMLAAATTYALSCQDHISLYELVERIEREPDILYFIVQDENNVVVASTDHELEGEILTDDISRRANQTAEDILQEMAPETEKFLTFRHSDFDLTVPIFVAEKKLGLIRLGISAKQINEEFAIIRSKGIKINIISIVVGAVVATLMAWGVTRPLKKLSRVTRRIADGDLTQRVKIRTFDELEDLGSAFNQMAIKLKHSYDNLEEQVEERTKELLESRKQLIHSAKMASIGVAHEIRNPLAGISGSAEVVKKRLKTGKDISRFLEMIFREIDRLNGVVDRFLNFARPCKSHLEQTQIHEVIDRTIPLISEMAKERKITFFKDFDERESGVTVDVDQMQQVFLNILVNSIQAMPDGGDLRFLTHRLNGKVCITISDTGCGISADELEQIFDPFFTTKSQGTGLGLSIAARIVEEHKGTISVESQEGKGTAFTIELPVNAGVKR